MKVRLETVESEKDLGVIIDHVDSAFSFRENISSKISIANRNLKLILKTFTFMIIYGQQRYVSKSFPIIDETTPGLCL